MCRSHFLIWSYSSYNLHPYLGSVWAKQFTILRYNLSKRDMNIFEYYRDNFPRSKSRSPSSRKRRAVSPGSPVKSRRHSPPSSRSSRKNKDSLSPSSSRLSPPRRHRSPSPPPRKHSRRSPSPVRVRSPTRQKYHSPESSRKHRHKHKY